MVPRREALLGSTFETRNSFSRGKPTMASAITSSASPYISAVSIWVMPVSMPRRSAARAALRSPRSRYQVPCPITDTSGFLLPNFFCFKITSTSDDADQTAAMQRKRVLCRQTAQPIAEARYLGAIRSAGRRNQPIADAGSLRHAVAAVARMVAEPAGDQHIDLALDQLVEACGLQHPQADFRVGCAKLRQFQTAQIEAAVHAELQQHRAHRLQFFGRVGDATKAAGNLGQIGLAGLGQNQLLMQPLEQAHAQACLQR